MKKMKRGATALLTIVLLLSLLPTQIFAASVTYSVTGGKLYFDTATGTITDADETITAAVIPAEIDGVAVTKIGDQAFASCRNLTSIAIPESVTEFGERVFQHCYALTSITIPEGVTELGYGTFLFCSALKSVDLPSALSKIPGSMCNFCDVLQSITIPEGVTEIGDSAFSYCEALQNISLPSTLNKIGLSAFEECNSLTDVTYNSKAENFWDNVTYLARNECLFAAMSDEIKALRPRYAVNGGYIYFDTHTGAITGADDSVTQANIPYKILGIPVTQIADAAFLNHTLQSVEFPFSLNTIGGSAFQGCASLQTVTIPEGVTEIGGRQFVGCKKLQKVTLPSTLVEIGAYIFNENNSLTSVVYNGTHEDWGKITVGTNNSVLLKALVCRNNPVANTPFFSVDDLSVQSAIGMPLAEIPDSKFTAVVSATSEAFNDDVSLLLAAYTADGQFVELQQKDVSGLSAGSTLKFKFSMDNTAGKIADLKAFAVTSLGDMIPLGEAKSFLSET